MKKKGEKEKRKIRNDKYPFEACATEHYPLRQYCYWVLFFEVILLLEKLTSCVNKPIM